MQKQNEENVPNAGREDWNAEKIAKESSNEESDETLRKVRRGNEDSGDADARDAAGSVKSDETPQGREESKNQAGDKENG